MSAAVGKKLRDAREALDLTLEQVAQETHIRLHYLRAMEAGQFDTIPSRVQKRGFLRSYAGFLRIDVQPLFDALEGDALLTFMPPKEQIESEEAQTEDTPEAQVADEPVSGLAAVGETLRSQRELLGLSREDVERHTHLRMHYLQALERGDMDALPSTVQGSGMLKNYAEFLGLDPEPLLLRFADDLQSQLSERRQSRPTSSRVSREPQQKSLLRRILSRDIIIVVSIVVFLIVFSLWAVTRIMGTRSAEEIEPTPPSIADVLLPSSTPTIEPTATATVPSLLDEAADADLGANSAAAEVTESPFVLEAAEKLIQLQIAIRQRAYMRITVDGEVDFDGRVLPGSIYAFSGDETVEILTGNAAGLHITYNGAELGVLGFYGEVVNFVIAADGIQTPTPTVSPTPTETPQTTLTPTQTPVP
ncbi:MAG: DUF4115 domain-containing protein [Anaerolineales bacterium]|nr:DUF4115 domain-containing protein [Chloroflexota bacterium]MBL6980931.1 DUF4115 domain-containing protein [Anaerolineales bacterium]